MTRTRARVGPQSRPGGAPPRRRRACSTTRRSASSCAAAPAASARRPRRRPWRCGPPSAGATSWCSPSTRPAGWRSRWASRSWTTPRARSAGDRRRGRRQPRRDDAGHEAHLRRGGREPGQPGEGAADPRQPLLPGAVELLRGHAGVHGDGEARADPPRRPARRQLRPDRGRHPAVAFGAGLPRRARAALELPRRPVHPAAARARAGPGAADDGRASASSPAR